MIRVGDIVRVTRRGAKIQDNPSLYGQTGVVIESDDESLDMAGVYLVRFFSDTNRETLFISGEVELLT